MATWDEDIVRALENLGGVAHYDSIYEEVARLRETLPPTWREIIRRRIQDMSSDSNGFKGGRDLFFSVDGLGAGMWGLRNVTLDTPNAIDLPKGNHDPSRSLAKTFRVIRDTELSKQIKRLYDDCCQICGVQMQLNNGKTYSEAHHIIPLGGEHKGPDTPDNILVLCPNHHALCDYAAIELSLKELTIKKGHVINPQSIKYHNEVLIAIYKSN